MPWTKADVDKHKKGLSDTQKERWVNIANSVLRKCIADGGTDASCAPKAIRQANGVVGNSEESFYATYRKKQLKGYEVTHQTHQGRGCLVVPVVMMVEGVHIGSHGPLLHEINELGRFPASWNGMPVVIDHPEIEGQNVSANMPDVIDARMIGRVYNTRVDGAKLVAQAWIDEERLRQLSSVILAQIEAGEPIEVSLGMFTEELTSEGEFNGEQYEAIARNHRPDHLALLPGGVGACSIADGCGIRANNKKGGQTQVDLKINGEELLKALKDFNKEGFSVNNFITDEDQGYRELVDAVRQKLDSMDSESSIHFLQEVYDDTVIYEVRMRVGGTRLFKQGYTFDGGVVELQGSPAEVRRKVDYIAMAESSSMRRTKFNTNKGGKKMADNAKECTPCVKEKVDSLIANSQGKYTEDNREMLETLDEELLDKIAKPIEKEVIKEVEKKVEVNKLTPEDQAALEFGKRQLRERRESWAKKIQDNTKGVWTEDELKTMSDATLEKLAKTVKEEEVVDYSLGGGGYNAASSSTIEPLYPAGVEIKQ